MISSGQQVASAFSLLTFFIRGDNKTVIYVLAVLQLINCVQHSVLAMLAMLAMLAIKPFASSCPIKTTIKVF